MILPTGHAIEPQMILRECVTISSAGGPRFKIDIPTSPTNVSLRYDKNQENRKSIY